VCVAISRRIRYGSAIEPAIYFVFEPMLGTLSIRIAGRRTPENARRHSRRLEEHGPSRRPKKAGSSMATTDSCTPT
jgi:hypothetical protein